jgi:hypothetical protein
MEYKIVESREIIRCQGYDRYLVVFRQNNEVVGLNYMQGCDETDLPFFLETYANEVDDQLLGFYNAIKFFLNGETEVERINQAINGHFGFHND